MSSGPDSEHDAWLHEALRHAPDAQVVPPASVSELILREAQAKARSAVPPAPVPSATAFGTFWAWLARPSVAAGAASMMIATVAGVMWWDRPIDEDRGPVIPATAPAAPAPKAAERAPEFAAAPAPEVKEAQAPAAPAAPVAAPSDRAVAKSEGGAKRRAAAGGESGGDTERRVNQPAATQPRPFPGTPTDGAPVTATAGTANDTATVVAAAKPATPVAPPPAIAMAPNPPAQPPVAAPAPPAPVAAAPMRERSEPAPNATTARRADVAEARSAAAPARMADAAKSADLSRQAFGTTELQKSAGMLAATTAPPTDIAALRQSLAAEPRRWTWQRAGGSPQPVNDRLRNWLAQVDTSAAAHWRRVPLTPPAGEQRDAPAGSAGPSRELRLLRDGRLVATLRLDVDVLRWEGAATAGHAASALQVPLDANAVQALAQSFP